ncbi:MAG: PorP/SprF family type IX secretion system membrane protein [Bacteroidota bacterium]
MTCLIAALLLSISISQAQQSRVYSQFFMNPFIYNPAYAGVEGHSVFFGMYRKQWSNIDGAPALSHVSFHTPLKGGLGVGFTAYNDQEGLINSTAIKGSLSYLLAIDRKHYLRVGMSLGGGTKSINTDGFDSPADPAFASLSESATFSLANFGATYHFGHFNVGFALPNLVGYELVGTESFSRIKVDPLGEALFKANYRGHINDDIAFEPHLLYRYNQNLPNQFEAALITHLKHIVWVGASYRQDAGIIALFGTKIKEKIGVGFAYDIGNSNFNDILGPTFEIHIGYHLGTKKDHAEHVSSFIKSHRKSLEERQEEARKKQEALDAQEEARNKDRLAALQEQRNNRLNKDKPTEEKPTDNTNAETEDAPPTGTDKQQDDKNQQDSVKETDSSTKTTDDKIPETTDKNDEAKTKAQSITDLIEKQRNAAKNDDTSSNDNSKEVAQNPAKTENPKDVTSQKESDAKNTDNNNVNDKVDSIESNKGDQEKTNDGSSTETIKEKTDETNVDNSKAEKANADQVDNLKVEDDKVTTVQNDKNDIADKQTSTNDAIADPVTDEIPVDKVKEDTRTIEELANSDIPRKVKKGNHLLELETGNYVVAGAFQVFDHAENFSDELFENGYRDVIVGYVTETKLYYVVVFQSKSVEKAKRQRTLLKQREGFTKIWLLTVE